MKINRILPLCACLILPGAPNLLAQNGVWTADASGNWSTTADWLGGTVANGTGNTADFSTINITADRTITLDTARTISVLKFGEVIPDHNWLLSGGNTLTLGTTPKINVVNQTATISSVIAGTAFTKLGTGTLVLNGSAVNTFTGALTNQAGVLTEDFSNLGTPANLINSGVTLNLSGGTLNLINGASASQTFASTSFGTGGNAINVGASDSLSLGALTYSGYCPVQYSTTGTITTSTAGGGPLGLMWANYSTYGASDWASTDLAGGTAGAAPYTVKGLSSVTGGYTTTMGGTGQGLNLDLTAPYSGGGSGKNFGATTVRFNTPGVTNVNVNGSWGVINAVLVTPNMGANNCSIGNGNWFAVYNKNAGTEWVVQNNPLAYFTIGSLINNEGGTGALTYVQSGPGTVVMPGTATVSGLAGNTANNYTGQSYLNGGFTVVQVEADLGAPATAAAANLNGGTIVGNAVVALDNGGATPRPLTLLGNGGGLAATAGNTLTVDGQIGSAAGAGPLVIGIPATSANGNVAGLLPGTGSGTANPTPVYGTGTVALTYPNGANGNFFYGGVIIVGGATLSINSQYALGGVNYGGLTFNNGTLQYNATLASGAAGTALDLSGAPVTFAGNGTIDPNGQTITYAKAIGSGGSGSLTVANSGTAGAGGLFLNGGNTYTGGTTVNSGATLGGTNTITGTVTWNSGSYAALTPGFPLAVSGSVTLNNAAVKVLATGLTTGTYTLLTAAGGISGGSTVNATPVGTGIVAGGYGGTVAISGNAVVLMVAQLGVAATWTDGNADQNWSEAGNWSGGVPHNPGDAATFGSGGVGSPVDLNQNETVGGITFNNASSYTITGGNTLTLDNTTHPIAVLVTAGSANAIDTAVALNGNVTATVNPGDALAFGGSIANQSGAELLTLTGGGTVALAGANSYGPGAGTVGTTVSGVTLQVGNSSALGAGDVSITANSTLQAGAAGLNLANNIAVASSHTATVDNNGYALTLSGAISGNASLAKIGNGTLTLSGNDTYAGNTTLAAGALALSADVFSPAILLAGGDLLGVGTFAVTNNLGIGAATGSAGGAGLIDAASGQTLTIAGVIASAGNTGINNLTVNSGAGNTGVVVLGNANTFNGTNVIAAGTEQLANPLALQDSTLFYNNQGGVLDFGTLTAVTLNGLLGSENLTLANDSSAAVALTLANNGGPLVYTGLLGDGGSGASLTIGGPGSQQIGSGSSGGATYAGATTLNQGSLILGGNTSLSGTLTMSGLNGPCTLSLQDAANFAVNGGIVLASAGGSAYPGVCTLNVLGNATMTATAFNFGTGSSRVPSCVLTLAGNATLNLSGGLELEDSEGSTAENNVVNLNGGTLATADFTLSYGTPGTHQATINFNGGVLEANANDPSSGAFLPAFTALTANVLTNGAVIHPNGFNITIAAALLHGSSPDGGLTVNGSGTLTLTGANTYTGGTFITNGTLALAGSGSIADSQTIVVGAGGLFNVSSASGFTLGSGQALSNFNSTAVLDGNINAGTGTLALNYSPGTPAFTITNGTLSLGSGTIFQINNLGPALALGDYLLISTNANATGFIAGTPPTSVTVGGNGLVTNTYPSLQITNGQLYLAIASGSITNPIVYPPVMAFPGALGFGANATGGRGGTVYHVTSLADDGSAGTLRAAVSQPNRIIVFDVGGYIQLGSPLSASSDLTIAGQTAPGGGIGLMGAELSFYNQNNIICRHLRVRQGGSGTTQSGINIGSSAGQAGNIILDHTSVEFGQWDSVDAVGTYNFTIQNCIIADPINQQFGAHVQGGNASYIGNLWVNAHNRQPLAKASTVYVNNTIYDYQAGYTTADTSGHFSHDIVNNYFITGPSSSSPNDDFFQFDGNQTVYAVGNLLDSSRNGTLNGSPTAPGGDIVSATPWSPVTATIPAVPAPDAYRIDVSSDGAFPSDQLDALVLSQVTSLGTSGNLITTPTATGLGNGGYGTIDGGTPLTETDGDGIPDIWKNAVGLNLYTNQAMATAPDGYTYIEDYLNWLAGPHAFVQTNATVIDLWPYTLGFTNGGVYTVSGANHGTVTLTNSHYAYFLPNPGFTGLASFNFAVADSDGTSMTNTMGLLVAIVYIPKNLVWRGDGVTNVWDTTNTADWFNGNNLITFNSSDDVTFDDTGSATPAVNLTGLVSPGGIVVNASQNYTFGGSGIIAGTASLTKSGSGTLTVNNANTFSGAVNLNSGALQLNDGSAIGSGALTIQNGVLVNNYAVGDYLNLGNALVVPAGDTATIDLGNSIDLTGSLTGAGTLNLNVQDTAATDEIKGNFSAFTGTVNLLGSGGLLLVANGGAFSGFQNALTTINAPVTLGFHDNSGGNTYYFGALSGTNANAAFYDAYAGAPTLNIGALNLSTTFAGQFQSSANVVKTGTGTLTLSGNSTHTGATTVSSGTLAVTGSFSSSPVTVDSGATLAGGGILGGGVTIQSGGSLSPDLGNGSFGTLTVSNNLTLNTPVLNFDLSSSPGGPNDEIWLPGGALSQSGVQTYNLNLVNHALGAGTYDLIGGAAGNNAGGSLATDLPSNTRQNFSLQNTASGVRLMVTGSAAALVWQGTNGSNWDVTTTTNWLNGSVADEFYNLDDVQFDDTATNGNVNINGVVQPAGVLVTNSLTAYTIGGGVLGGITSLTKSGPGSLTLNSSNSFTGGTLVDGGTLQLADNVYAGGFGPITLNGGTLFLNNVGTPTTVSCIGANTLQTYGQPYAGFGLQGSGQLNLTIGGGGVFSPYGDWSGFSGTINFTTGNELRVLAAPTFGSASAVWILGNSTAGLYNKYGGCTISLGAVFGGPNTSLSGATTATASLTTYMVGGVNTNSVFNGIISDGGAAPTALVFNGPGSLTLAGNNTFTGNTTVNGGTLWVNNPAGSGTGAGTVTINSGATLGGNGLIGGVVSLTAGATLAPGSNGVGTLTVTNDLSLNDASTLEFPLGASSPQVAVTGDLTLGGTLNLSAAAGFGPGTYALFTYGGALSVGVLSIGAAPAGYSYTVDTSVPGQVNVIVSQPSFGGLRVVPGGLVISGSGGLINAAYYLLSSTNLAAPVSSWTRLQTNQFDAGGNFNLTNAFTPGEPQLFYRLQLP